MRSAIKSTGWIVLLKIMCGGKMISAAKIILKYCAKYLHLHSSKNTIPMSFLAPWTKKHLVYLFKVQLFECIHIVLIQKNPNHFPYFHPTSSELQTFHVKVAILHSVGVLCVLFDGIFPQPTNSRALIFFPQKKKESKGGKFPTTRTNRFNFHKLSTHHHPGNKSGCWNALSSSSSSFYWTFFRCWANVGWLWHQRNYAKLVLSLRSASRVTPPDGNRFVDHQAPPGAFQQNHSLGTFLPAVPTLNESGSSKNETPKKKSRVQNCKQNALPVAYIQGETGAALSYKRAERAKAVGASRSAPSQEERKKGR